MAREFVHHFTAGPDAIWAALPSATQHLGGVRVMGVDPSRHTVQLSSDMNLVSWGHNIVARVEPSAGGCVLVMSAATKFMPSVFDINKMATLFNRLVALLGHVPADQAGWHPDPARRHHLRYWDGTRWTEHVSDAGRPAIDPL